MCTRTSPGPAFVGGVMLIVVPFEVTPGRTTIGFPPGAVTFLLVNHTSLLFAFAKFDPVIVTLCRETVTFVMIGFEAEATP